MTIKYIQDSLHITISPDYVYHVKMQLKRDSARELSLLQKDGDYYLKNTFFDRVVELEVQQQVLWAIVNNNMDKPEVQINAIHELHALTMNLTNGFKNLPEVVMLQVPSSYDDNSNHNLSIVSNEPDFGSTAVF